MQQLPPGTSYVESKPPKWLWVVPVVSMGFLTPLSPIVVAAKLREGRAWGWTAAIVVAWLAGAGMLSSQPETGENALSDIGFMIYLAAMIGAIVFVLVLGPKVAWSKATPQSAGLTTQTPSAATMPLDPNASAIAEAQAARKKRADARQLAASDPGLARDLRIGRPDLPRQYDDGGLVDVNSAPAEALAKWLGLSADQAQEIAAARDHVGGFSQAEDVIALTTMTPQVFDQVKDRIILL